MFPNSNIPRDLLQRWIWSHVMNKSTSTYANGKQIGWNQRVMSTNSDETSESGLALGPSLIKLEPEN